MHAIYANLRKIIYANTKHEREIAMFTNELDVRSTRWSCLHYHRWKLFSSPKQQTSCSNETQTIPRLSALRFVSTEYRKTHYETKINTLLNKKLIISKLKSFSLVCSGAFLSVSHPFCCPCPCLGVSGVVQYV